MWSAQRARADFGQLQKRVNGGSLAVRRDNVMAGERRKCRVDDELGPGNNEMESS
jgi:hypothetical protein